MDDRSRTVIAKYLHDVHSLVEHGHQAIRRQKEQLKDSGHADALAAVSAFEETMDQHIERVQARLKAMGESTTSPVQDAASTVAGVVAGVYNAVRSEEASKSVRDDYTFFSHCAIAYLMLHTTAHALGDHETMLLAERGYRDAARMAMEVDRVMPGLVIAELKQDGLPARDVAEDCKKMVHEAWTTGSSTTAGAYSPARHVA